MSESLDNIQNPTKDLTTLKADLSEFLKAKSRVKGTWNAGQFTQTAPPKEGDVTTLQTLDVILQQVPEFLDKIGKLERPLIEKSLPVIAQAYNHTIGQLTDTRIDPESVKPQQTGKGRSRSGSPSPDLTTE